MITTSPLIKVYYIPLLLRCCTSRQRHLFISTFLLNITCVDKLLEWNLGGRIWRYHKWLRYLWLLIIAITCAFPNNFFFRSEGFYLPPFSLNLLNISQQRVAFLIAVRSQDQLSWETPPPASLDQLQHGRLQPYLSAYLVIPVSYHDKCCSFR